MPRRDSERIRVAPHLSFPSLLDVRNNNHQRGPIDLAFSEDVATRFIGTAGLVRVGDANDLDMLERAFNTFTSTADRPTLLIVDSHIAYGSPNKQDTHAAHGEPLGEEEIRLTKRNYGWPEDAKFLVPDGVREHFQAMMGKRGRQGREAWMAKFAGYGRQYPELADQLDRMQHRRLPEGWDQDLPTFPADPRTLSDLRQGVECHGEKPC